MNPWSCKKCKKEFSRDDLTELFGWGYSVCTPCINEWLKLEETEVNLQGKMNWISVKDRLPPKEGKIYLAVSSERGIGTIQWVSGGKYWSFRADSYYGNLEEVTHWMPLPNPPEEE